MHLDDAGRLKEPWLGEGLIDAEDDSQGSGDDQHPLALAKVATASDTMCRVPPTL